MSTDVTDLSSLNPEDIKTREQQLIQMLSEQFPTLDFTQGGILQQLLTHPNTVLDVLNRQEIQNLQNSMSLLTIQENPELADDATVDALLSNYMVTREAATSTRGVMGIVLSRLITTQLPVTTVFTANGRTFVPDQAYTAVANTAQVVDDTTKLLTVRPDGNYWFTINVIETVTGGTAVYQSVAFEVLPEPDNFVQAYAASDFAPGTAAADNAEAVAQLADGVSVKAVADRVSTSALLKKEFPGILDISIIGYGDMEMSRDRGNIFGIGGGGKADMYVRTTSVPASTKIMVMAVPMSVRYQSVYAYGQLNGADKIVEWGARSQDPIYELMIPPTAVPGFYRVNKITPIDPTSSTTAYFNFNEPGARGIYLLPDQESTPLINTADEARYTPYQGMSYIRLIDPSAQQSVYDAVASIYTDTSVAVTFYKSGVLVTETAEQILSAIQYEGARIYDVYLDSAPSLLEIQTYVNTRSHQAPVADYLVKGAVPCFVGGSVTVGYKSGTQVPVVSTLQNAIAEAINSVPFSAASLPVSVVVQAITDVLGANGYVILPATLTGTLMMPDGTTQNLSSTSSLDIPTDTANHISRRVVAYYATPSDINIYLQPVSSWSV